MKTQIRIRFHASANGRRVKKYMTVAFHCEEIAAGFARGFNFATTTDFEKAPCEMVAKYPGFDRGVQFYWGFIRHVRLNSHSNMHDTYLKARVLKEKLSDTLSDKELQLKKTWTMKPEEASKPQNFDEDIYDPTLDRIAS